MPTADLPPEIQTIINALLAIAGAVVIIEKRWQLISKNIKQFFPRDAAKSINQRSRVIWTAEEIQRRVETAEDRLDYLSRMIRELSDDVRSIKEQQEGDSERHHVD